MSSQIVRFDEAFERARSLLRERASSVGGRIVLVRDVQGRLAVLSDAPKSAASEGTARALAEALGAFGGEPDELWLTSKDFFDAERIFGSPDARPLFSPRVEDGPANVLLIERSIIGLDWMRPPLAGPSDRDAPEPPRLSFFGLKGGVGRSTALVLAARALARADARVLVVDLDIESPGLGPILLPDARVPDYGIVDFLVEEAIGQANDALLAGMVASSPLVPGGAGEVRVVPAAGARGDYLAKLGRAYQPALIDGETRDFAERMDGMIARLAAQEQADVVLLDSRAGLHDIAALAVTRLRADALLFSIGTAQTWRGYRLLFEDWRRHPQLAEFRERLHMVAALVPETGREAYLQQYLESSHTLFSETLYETADPHADPPVPDAFNFDLHDESAPHFHWPIYWNRALSEFDPVHHPGALPDDQLLGAAGPFCRSVGALLDREVVP